MSDETPIPPQAPQPVTPRNIGLSIWRWSQVHTVAATIIVALLAGFILGKVL